MFESGVLIFSGVLLLAAFAYVNLVLQPRWFPAEVEETAANAGSSAGLSRTAHLMLGIAMLALILLGVCLVVAGSVEIGILRSRG